MMTCNRHRRERSRPPPRGQAMLEYSLLTFVLLVTLIFGLTLSVVPRPVPGDPNARANLITLFFQAYEQYYNSFYFVLNLPFP